MEANTNHVFLPKSSIKEIEALMPYVQELTKEYSENKTQAELTKLSEFTSLLASHLEGSKATVDLKYLASGEAKKIFKRIFENSIRENQPEKLELLSRFLINFCNLQFSDDDNKEQLLEMLEKINPKQALILRDITEWLVLAFGRDTVKQSTDYQPLLSEHPYVGYIMESIAAILAHLTVEKTAPLLDEMIETGLLAVANNGDPVQHSGQTGRCFKPSKPGLQLLTYLGIPVEKIAERGDYVKKQ